MARLHGEQAIQQPGLHARCSPGRHNLTHLPSSTVGTNRAMVADQDDRLTAAVTKLLGPGATNTFVAALTGGPGADDGTGEFAVTSGGGAGQGAQVEPTPAGQTAALPFLLADGFMQFEGPSFSSQSTGGKPAADLSVQEASVQDAAPAPLRVTLAATGDDPLALCEHASDTAARETLASDLAAMGLTLSGEPSVVPLQGGKVLALASPPAPSPSPSPQPEPQAPVAPAAPLAPITTEAPADTTANAPADTTTNADATTSSGSGGGGGLSGGAIAGIVVGSVIGAAAVIVVAALLCKRQRGAAGSASSATAPGAQGPPKAADDVEAGAAVAISAVGTAAATFSNPAFADTASQRSSPERPPAPRPAPGTLDNLLFEPSPPVAPVPAAAPAAASPPAGPSPPLGNDAVFAVSPSPLDFPNI